MNKFFALTVLFTATVAVTQVNFISNHAFHFRPSQLLSSSQCNSRLSLILSTTLTRTTRDSIKPPESLRRAQSSSWLKTSFRVSSRVSHIKETKTASLQSRVSLPTVSRSLTTERSTFLPKLWLPSLLATSSRKRLLFSTRKYQV